MGVFAGFSSAAIALVASQVPEERLGYSLGWLSTGQLVGSLVGPIIGGVLADMTGSYRIPFYCTAATILLSTGLVWFIVHEEFDAAAEERGAARSTLSGLVALARSPALAGAVFRAADGAVRRAHGAADRDALRQGDGRRSARTSRPWPASPFRSPASPTSSSAPFLGNRSDRIGYRRVLLICLAGGDLTTLPQAFTDNYWLFTAERFAVGLFIGGLLPTANALVGRLVSRSERGAVYGMTASAMFLGNSLGPLIGGAVAAGFGLRWVFLLTAAVMVANLVWVYYRVPEYVDREE